MVKRLLCVWLLGISLAQPAFAATIIRDAEIESSLRRYADPIFEVAGLKPSAVKLFIIQEDTINAFVAGGSNMFINTGLILACETPDMLLGVIAHETGHIAGGHLAKGTEKLKNAQLGAIMTFVLGAVAGVASQDAGAAAAVITGGQNTLQRNLLAFTRTNEEAADQSALSSLEKLKISASGMLKVFSVLQRNERQHPGSRDPYLLTHPLSSSRIQNVRDSMNRSNTPEGTYPADLLPLHQRMLAKLYGFIESPERTLQHYPLSDKSVPARMARAIAYYKMPDLNRSLKEMDALLIEAPEDPYLNELKGQILFENGKVTEALNYYEKAIKYVPNNSLILTDLGKVELAQKPPLLTSAIAHLERATQLDNSNGTAWRFLATAYGKSGNLALSALALAEEALLQNNPKAALVQVEQALKTLPEQSPANRRASDIKAHALDMQKMQNDK
ncbi:MAG: M48 family metalloprotease [Rickettsiales bacterium]|nr:M48 family metalloprotease [Rickettsiales bacterium]